MKRKNDEGYEKATQEMEAGETLLINRQDMIKLADRSELCHRRPQGGGPRGPWPPPSPGYGAPPTPVSNFYCSVAI